mmetsp:Transcript_38831/g.44428  ORF Transcript_38831/g.44428 Transcript_38831/m.44428 type:complete len:102 (-) Transcript_38831:191-496(-)
MNMLIMSVDPREETAICSIHQLYAKLGDEVCKEKETEETEGQVRSPPCPVYIVVNHCDSSERVVGTDALLKATQKYGYALIELSSLSGVNLEFLINHIICQ